MLRRRPIIVAAILLFALLAGLGGIRAVRLASGAPLLDGHDERMWHAWAERDPAAAGVFRELAGCAEAAGSLELRVPQHPRWWRSMARYYLPDRQSIRVEVSRVVTMGGLRRLGLLEQGTRFGRLSAEGVPAAEILRLAERAGWEGDPVLAKYMRARRHRLTSSADGAARVTVWLGGGGFFEVWRDERLACWGGTADPPRREPAP